jgi:hypothetical protein
VNVASVSLGIPITGYGQQGDTDPLPLAISQRPSGGSLLAALGTDGNVYIAQLDCSDQPVGKPFSLPGIDLQDVYADDSGGVVALVRNATNGGTDNCGTGMLCGGTSSPCRTTWLVRFDNSGKVAWETQLTNLSSSRAGYDSGAMFTWWYQHHVRIASDGTNYACYFSAAGSIYRTGNSGCIDIHEGDFTQLVGPSGNLQKGFGGCGHSWTDRIVWDKSNSAFVETCATDAQNCAIERPDQFGKVLFQGSCSNQFFNGDLINDSTGGYWSAWSDLNVIHLDQWNFSNAKGPSVANAGAAQHPHLVPIGASNMLLSWGSGTGIAAQVRAMTDGSTVGSQFTINVKDHVYIAFKAYADGSAAYPGAGKDSMSVNVARVMPCQ